LSVNLVLMGACGSSKRTSISKASAGPQIQILDESGTVIARIFSSDVWCASVCCIEVQIFEQEDFGSLER